MGNAKGFLNIILVIAAAVIIGGGGFFFLKNRRPEKVSVNNQEYADQEHVQEKYASKEILPSKVTPPTSVKKSEPPKGIGLFGQPCEGKGVAKLNTFPINPENIELITPMGRVQDSHVTPTDHQYIIPVGTKGGSLVTDNPKKYSIKAPANGHIITIELFKQPVEEQYRNQPYQDNYLVLFEHSCDHYTRLIHIDTLSDKVITSFSFKDPSSSHPYASTRIPVKEGEVIGTIGSHSFDFQIMDSNVKDKNLISPKNIDHFSAYTVDTFKYLSDSLKTALLKKNLTKTEPLGGKIGYDVPGTLMGNWFLIGRSSARESYWTNNLSIVYDHLDPSQIRISFGNFDGYPKAFGIKGNSPDPVTKNTASGIIKYELVKFDYFSDGKLWDTIHYADNLKAQNTNEVAGVVLFQLLDDRKLKVETFPRKTASEVSGFTSAAQTYER
ncbi:MAG: Uncharacterized protein G01um101419_81 [Parcubacteria group bacterium Gr01-1014_19]|nr:MAG: Uncharacterized protein G01um101419_81 [Parcubacteria group bacterium Gr01-1014_19]